MRAPRLPSSATDDAFTLEAIGHVASDYPDKFGIPRQPGLAPSARAILYLAAPFDDPLAVEGLEAVTHLWLTFVFDRSPQSWTPRVRPPRLGGNQRIGVFASRSTHRPNRLGLSLVELVDVECTPKPSLAQAPIVGSRLAEQRSRVKLHLRGHDLCDATPVVDIKPYLPWAESRPDADAGFAPAPPPRHRVTFSLAANDALQRHDDGQSLARLIDEVLAQDPRPAYHGGASSPSNRDDTARCYGVFLRDVNVRFRVRDRDGKTEIHVEAIEPR
ncbi:tRNA (N6-threonylcarbamoyladenosine(37)-N6)-methyltransferase TrmO [Salinicola sp. MH3R3-1]|uniref:tRNA (N6-threonylcarbamoyladenosine(37)-N6)-methyltransferase TrmO n=1 Tax=Salinicola sp. MH3R3-1 TaxID=1928762 RepID=UPI00094F361A|nr:tRNA (N6-threonylcarbamoyladenosine(37)-N6)-methyltransferase TrmO [Salinicola sp. MH3R3-1]OLO06514.1 tRNA (N6-threonylcarbamoyladenosine(37)-N6)-methyltransferase TrmO [Salinicola sp. MH3R3-1]